MHSLSERRYEQSTFTGQTNARVHFTPTTMLHVKRILVRETEDGSTTIPETAWRALIREMRDTFDAILEVHDHDGPGAFHGYDFVPAAHYLLRLAAGDIDQLNRAIGAVNPRIEELVKTFTRTSVPADR